MAIEGGPRRTIIKKGAGKGAYSAYGKGQNAWENVLLIATVDNTEIYLNGSLIPYTTIDKNEFTIIEGNYYDAVSVPTIYANTSENVYAFQSIGGTTAEKNQGMFLQLFRPYSLSSVV